MAIDIKNMNSMKTCNSVTFFFMKNEMSDISMTWILPNMILVGTDLIIFGKMHFLLISEYYFFHQIKCNRMTSLMDFMKVVAHYIT